MGRTVAFLAETQGSATIDDQRARLDSDDFVVLAGRQNLNKLGEILACQGISLDPGDRVKVFDLSCISLSTTTLIRVLTKMLSAGIIFEIVSLRIVLEPGAESKLHAFIDALDGHYRHVHGIKTHPADTAPQGRKRLLDPDQLPSIREKLDQPGATATNVAQELGVARSTLFNYLDRYDQERRSKAGKRRAEDACDDGGITEDEANQTSA